MPSRHIDSRLRPTEIAYKWLSLQLPKFNSSRMPIVSSITNTRISITLPIVIRKDMSQYKIRVREVKNTMV